MQFISSAEKTLGTDLQLVFKYYATDIGFLRFFMCCVIQDSHNLQIHREDTFTYLQELLTAASRLKIHQHTRLKKCYQSAAFTKK